MKVGSDKLLEIFIYIYIYQKNLADFNGALGRIRTPDPLIRSQVLYPTELPVRVQSDLSDCEAAFKRKKAMNARGFRHIKAKKMISVNPCFGQRL